MPWRPRARAVAPAPASRPSTLPTTARAGGASVRQLSHPQATFRAHILRSTSFDAGHSIQPPAVGSRLTQEYALDGDGTPVQSDLHPHSPTGPFERADAQAEAVCQADAAAPGRERWSTRSRVSGAARPAPPETPHSRRPAPCGTVVCHCHERISGATLRICRCAQSIMPLSTFAWRPTRRNDSRSR